MFLDLVFLVLLVLAIIKGYQRGLIVGVFSFIAIIIALAAAMKLSLIAAGYIGEAVNMSSRWLPLVSFAIVFILVVLLIRVVANLIQKTVELSMLGWLNKLGGIIFYLAIYILVYSVVLFYAEQVKLIQDAAIQNSVTYTFVQPWGPEVIEGFASVVSIFKGMFNELELFFDGVAKKIPQ